MKLTASYIFAIGLLLSLAACDFSNDAAAYHPTPTSMEASPSTSDHCSMRDLSGGVGSLDCH